MENRPERADSNSYRKDRQEVFSAALVFRELYNNWKLLDALGEDDVILDLKDGSRKFFDKQKIENHLESLRKKYGLDVGYEDGQTFLYNPDVHFVSEASGNDISPALGDPILCVESSVLSGDEIILPAHYFPLAWLNRSE